MRLIISGFFLISFLLALGSIAYAQYKCDWNVVSAGGTTTTGSNLAASVSVAQTGVGFLTGTNFNATIGFWQIDTPTVSIKEVFSRPLFLRTELLSVQPNPFSRETKIFYSLGKEADVSLLIYNSCGQIVERFSTPKQKPGLYSFSFSGEDKGKQLSKGIYFCKFQADDYLQIKKLILVR